MEGKKRSAARIKAGVSITALAAAVAMFVILLQVEKSVLEQYEKGVVYVAGAPIPKGQMITQENFALYFTEQELDVRCIPLTALKRPEQVQGLAAVFDVEEGVLRADIRDEFKGCNVYAKEKCRKCFAKFYCSGGCAANSYNFHGNINDAYDVGCELERKRVECAIMLKVAEAYTEL